MTPCSVLSYVFVLCSYVFVLCLCPMSLSYGFVLWLCPMSLSYGFVLCSYVFVLWLCPMALSYAPMSLSYGFVLALSYVFVLWLCPMLTPSLQEKQRVQISQKRKGQHGIQIAWTSARVTTTRERTGVLRGIHSITTYMGERIVMKRTLALMRV